MNVDKLKEAESNFLSHYPGGFEHPDMVAIGKKHRMEQMTVFAREAFGEAAFDDPATVAEDMIKIMTRSSMVSVFEKPRFRDSVRAMADADRAALTDALKDLLHHDEQRGFDAMVSLLAPAGIAKWPVVTVFGCYYRPDRDLLFKPTTVKKVVDYFELQTPPYRSLPYYAFFAAYREAINQMKKYVAPSLSPSNAAFSGFLMMTVGN